MSVDLSHFDEKAKPVYRESKSAKELPDGEYVFEIQKAMLKESKKQKTPILTMEVVVVGGPHDGGVFERPSFLTSQESFNALLADMAKLKFDASEWTVAKGRPPGSEVQKAVNVLPGMKFKGEKKTNGEFANINITERLTDAQPNPVTADDLEKAKDPF